MSEQRKTVADHAEKTGSPALGNALAFFVVPYLHAKGYIPIEMDDGRGGEIAVLMGGAVIAAVLMYLRQSVLWVARLIEKIVDRP